MLAGSVKLIRRSTGLTTPIIGAMDLMSRAILNKRTLSLTILYLSLAILNFSSVVIGEEYSSVTMEIVQMAKRECTDFENGKFNSTQQVITRYRS